MKRLRFLIDVNLWLELMPSLIKLSFRPRPDAAAIFFSFLYGQHAAAAAADEPPQCCHGGEAGWIDNECKTPANQISLFFFFFLGGCVQKIMPGDYLPTTFKRTALLILGSLLTWHSYLKK